MANNKYHHRTTIHHIFQLLTLSLILKTLLFPFYHSTDFEVHRNWLALTHSLPLHQWYHDNTSEWTLDYPPFFAYFEYFLSYFAAYFDSNMIQIQNLNFESQMTIFFQRSSVLVSECVLYIATVRYLKSSSMSVTYASSSRRGYDAIVVFLLVVFNAGLIIVDNIHFQYNGMMLGLIILCGDFANRNQHLALATTFSILVLLKHLFVPLAPLVGAYLIKAYCVQCPGCACVTQTTCSSVWNFKVWNFLQLCFIAIVALMVAFLPFLVIFAPALEPAPSIFASLRSVELLTFDAESGSGGGWQVQLLLPFVSSKCIFDWEYSIVQMQQIMSRLFPFGRGLVHAYWAPNVWAIYIMLDKFLKIVAGKLAVQSMQSQSLALSVVAFALCPSYDSTETGSLNASTSGLVGEFQFSCLASVPAGLSMFLVVVMQLPAVVMILRQPHVHDKSPGTTPVLAQGLFLKSAAYAAVTLFMFGYHVHEKAILVALIPLTVLLRPSCVDGVVGPGFESVRERERWHAVYLQVAAGGVTALLPLLMNVEELALKGILCFSFLGASNFFLGRASGPTFSRLNRVTIVGLLILFVFNELIHPWYFWSPALDALRYPFLPLLLYSTVCALILIHAYVLMIFAFFDLEPISFTFFFGRGDDNDNGNDSGSNEWVIGLWERLYGVFFTRMRGRGKKQDNLRKPPVSRGLPPSPQ